MREHDSLGGAKERSGKMPLKPAACVPGMAHCGDGTQAESRFLQGTMMSLIRGSDWDALN